MQITLQASAVGTLSWQAPVDVLITGFGAMGSGTLRCVLSSDQNATSAAFTAPSANSADRNALAFSNGGAPAERNLKIPLFSGERTYVAFSAAGSAILFLEPLS